MHHSPNELLLLALLIATAATTYFAVLALARRLGVRISTSWRAEGRSLWALAFVACASIALVPWPMSVTAILMGAVNGAAIVLWTWLALRRFRGGEAREE